MPGKCVIFTWDECFLKTSGGMHVCSYIVNQNCTRRTLMFQQRDMSCYHALAVITFPFSEENPAHFVNENYLKRALMFRGSCWVTHLV